MKRVRVKGSAIETAFDNLTNLSFGPYRVEVDCDRARQYPKVVIPKDAVLRAESGFAIDFTDDVAAPLQPLSEALATFTALLAELEQAHKDNAGKAEAFHKFREAWSQKLGDASGKVALKEEDVLYPDTHMSLGGVAHKLQLFADLYESQVKGEKNPTFDSHPNWFEPEPSADIARVRRLLVREFGFNTARKVVDYGYDKATELLKDSRGGNPAAPKAWDLFRTRFSKDLEHCRTAYDTLMTGPLKAETQAFLADLPAIVSGGHQLLEAIDAEMAAPGKGKAGLDKAKETLVVAYKSLVGKVTAEEKPDAPKPEGK